MTWYQAKDACQQKGGKLPEINNASETLNLLRLKVAITVSLYQYIFSLFV